MNKKELLAKLQNLLKSMREESDPTKFKALNEEFLEVKGQLDRIDALEAAEKSLVVEAAAKEKPPAAEPAEKAFAAAARKGFKGMSEGVAEDGGYTVPVEVSTRIETFREAKFHLGQLADNVTVKTKSGQRTFQKRGNGAGFASVEEGGKIPMTEAPKFVRQSYSVTKHAGYMFATNELLADSDANITGTIVEWFGENDRVTRNKLVLATLDEPYTRKDDPAQASTVSGLDDLKRIVNVELGQAFAPTARIVTNDDGLQFLDTLKDADGKALIKYSDAEPLKPYVAVGFRKVPLVIVPNSDMPSDPEKGAPVWVGDFHEAVRIYDRKRMSLMASNVATIGAGEDAINAFGEDLTIWRAIVRLDCRVKDEEAYRKAYFKASAVAVG